MAFFIHGRDSATFDDSPHALHEVHQSYLDQWSSQLLARGPTLSDDGSRHTGSIHVLDTDDPELARRLAFDEPYAQEGWYAEIVVTRYESLVDGTMWDRPVTSPDQESSFALVGWPPSTRSQDLHDAIRAHVSGADGPQWPFAGLLIGDDPDEVVGMAGSVDRPAAEAEARLHELLEVLRIAPIRLEVHRWRRGGRG